MSLGGAFRVLVSELPAVGLDPTAVCRAARVDPRIVTDASIPFGYEELRRVLDQAVVSRGDPHLGLHLAAGTRGRGVLSYVARAQRTIGDGLDAFARFAATSWGVDDAVRIERRDRHAAVCFRTSELLSRHALEFLMARTALSLRRSGATLRALRFAYAPYGDAAEYERILGCPARFRQSETAVVFDAADLDLPLATANPEAAATLAAGLVHTGERAASAVATKLALVVESALGRGDRLHRETLARSLGMSGKTLARRLGDERHCFRDVVDGVRRALAHRLVLDGGLDLSAVAERVGFADQAAFGKAFRRWYGDSPSVFRTRRAAG